MATAASTKWALHTTPFTKEMPEKQLAARAIRKRQPVSTDEYDALFMGLALWLAFILYKYTANFAFFLPNGIKFPARLN